MRRSVEIILKNYIHILYYILIARIELSIKFLVSCIAAICLVPISSHLNIIVATRKLLDSIITWRQLSLSLNDTSRCDTDAALYTIIDRYFAT